MKKAFLLLLVAVLFGGTVVRAQSFGQESPVMDRNILVGIKVGVNAMDMSYRGTGTDFTNPSVIYSHPLQFLSCFSAGLTVERVIPNFSYGVEVRLSGMNAKTDVQGSSDLPYVTQDSSLFLHVRVPLKVRFWDKKRFSPYLVVAPSVGTYVSGKLLSHNYDGYSVWNGQPIQWGTNNTTNFQLSVYGGIGVEAKIDVGSYQFRLRLEGGYDYGLTNMTPKTLGFQRSMRGWEATLGLAFPLFINPSYSWLM